MRLETSNTGVTISGVLSATGGDSDDWNTAYGWGDHSLVGYLTNADTTDWNTAYGWGDHSQAGYLTSVALNNNDVSDVIVTTPSIGDLLSWNGSNWVNITTPETTFISDTPPTTPNPGDLWWESDSGRLKVYYQDVDTSQWVDAFPPLANPFNVTASDAQNWNTAYGWGDHSTGGYLTFESDTLADVTGRGASTNSNITFNGTIDFYDTVEFKGTNGDSSVHMYDENAIHFGDQNDGKIIYNSTGNIVKFERSGSAGEIEINATPVTLKHSDSTKLQTTGAGVTITGICSATGGVQIGAGQSFGANGPTAVYYGDGSNLTNLPAAGLTTAAGTAAGIVTTLFLSSAQDHKVTASGITTITVSGGTEADSHTVRIINSGITTIGFSTYFLFPSGSAPSLPTASGAISLISFTVNRVGAGGTQLLAGASVNYS